MKWQDFNALKSLLVVYNFQTFLNTLKKVRKQISEIRTPKHNFLSL